MNESYYKATYLFKQDLKNVGFDYSGNILNKTCSKYLFQNENLSSFLTKINSLLYHLVESAKYVRIYINYTVEKDCTYIN